MSDTVQVVILAICIPAIWGTIGLDLAGVVISHKPIYLIPAIHLLVLALAADLLGELRPTLLQKHPRR